MLLLLGVVDKVVGLDGGLVGDAGFVVRAVGLVVRTLRMLRHVEVS